MSSIKKIQMTKRPVGVFTLFSIYCFYHHPWFAIAVISYYQIWYLLLSCEVTVDILGISADICRWLAGLSFQISKSIYPEYGCPSTSVDQNKNVLYVKSN